MNTAGVLGAHLHPSTVHLLDVAGEIGNGSPSPAIGGGGGGGTDGSGGIGGDLSSALTSPSSGVGASGVLRPTSASSTSASSFSSAPSSFSSASSSSSSFRQVVFAAAGHKMTVSPLPLRGEAQATPRYFSDRHGHKVHRHQLTAKSTALLPLWRVLLVGGSDDKIRICQ